MAAWRRFAPIIIPSKDGMDLDFKQLEAFVAAVEEGSFSNAADRLQLSQSMVTIHIRNLERELGARLLNRTTRSMELSADGRAFYAYAREMLRLNRESLMSLCRVDRDQSVVEIVAPRFITRYYLSDLVVDFKRLHPEIAFKFIPGSNAEMHAKLENDGCPFAFCNMKLLESDYAVKHIGTADLVVIAPDDARFRSLAGKPFPAALFGEFPMITRSGTSTLQQEFMRWKKQTIPDVRLRVAADVDDTETIKRLVSAGVGISVITDFAARDYANDGRVLLFPLQGAMPYQLYFAYRKKFLSPENALFRDYVLDCAQAHHE